MRRSQPHLSRHLAVLLTLAPAPVYAAEPPTWVFFADRDLDDQALAAALDARAAELSPRALARRQRVRHDAGVDARDLPPAPARVAAVLATGARLRSTSRWLNAVSVDADAAQLAAITALPAVAALQPVARRRAAALQAPRAAAPVARDATYGVAREQLDRLRVPDLHACGLTGAGVVVGVQDSGFSLAHAALAGVDVIAAHDFLQDDDIVADEPGDPDGQDHHGTMILSLLAGDDPGSYMGAAPGVSLILAKTEDSSVEEPFEEDRFVEGLEWIESMGADLFTSSLGYADWYAPEDFDGNTAVTSRAALVALEQGLIVISAVGNAGPGPTTLVAPSDVDGVIAVGAVDPDGLVAEFSSRGPTADGRIKPDIAAPGQAVWVAHPTKPNKYAQTDGTSLAAPLAAGTAALLLQALPGLDPASMRMLLQQSASLADTPNNDLGWGVPDVTLPLAEYCADRPDPAESDTTTGESPLPDDTGDSSLEGSASSDDTSADDPASSGELAPEAELDEHGCACTTTRGARSGPLLLVCLLSLARRRR